MQFFQENLGNNLGVKYANPHWCACGVDGWVCHSMAKYIQLD